jgi:excisionase family DNA binding protein
MFGISKDTIHRMIKKGLIGGANLGIRLTRVKRADLENLFSTIEMPIEKKKEEKPNFEIGNCYTISEISTKFADPSTIYLVIKKNKIPTKKVGSFVYAPKILLTKFRRTMKELLKTKVTVRLRKAEFRKEWYIYLESYPVMISGKKSSKNS